METDDDIAGYYARHCATPNGVVLAEYFDSDGDGPLLAIFSCLERAHEWADTLPKGGACIFAPFYVDEPDYGNIAPEEMQ